jgi:hypothetical protein
VLRLVIPTQSVCEKKENLWLCVRVSVPVPVSVPVLVPVPVSVPVSACLYLFNVFESMTWCDCDLQISSDDMYMYTTSSSVLLIAFVHTRLHPSTT